MLKRRNLYQLCLDTDLKEPLGIGQETTFNYL